MSRFKILSLFLALTLVLISFRPASAQTPQAVAESAAQQR